VIGFRDGHGRAHLYRALIEGLAYALRDGVERIERRLGRPLDRLVAAGGGSSSDAVVQVLADVIGRPIERPEHSEAAAWARRSTPPSASAVTPTTQRRWRRCVARATAACRTRRMPPITRGVTARCTGRSIGACGHCTDAFCGPWTRPEASHLAMRNIKTFNCAALASRHNVAPLTAIIAAAKHGSTHTIRS
jgi:Sugar (pentulose and hexulose) kinases